MCKLTKYEKDVCMKYFEEYIDGNITNDDVIHVLEGIKSVKDRGSVVLSAKLPNGEYIKRYEKSFETPIEVKLMYGLVSDEEYYSYIKSQIIKETIEYE